MSRTVADAARELVLADDDRVPRRPNRSACLNWPLRAPPAVVQVAGEPFASRRPPASRMAGSRASGAKVTKKTSRPDCRSPARRRPAACARRRSRSRCHPGPARRGRRSGRCSGPPPQPCPAPRERRSSPRRPSWCSSRGRARAGRRPRMGPPSASSPSSHRGEVRRGFLAQEVRDPRRLGQNRLGLLRPWSRRCARGSSPGGRRSRGRVRRSCALQVGTKLGDVGAASSPCRRGC